MTKKRVADQVLKALRSAARDAKRADGGYVPLHPDIVIGLVACAEIVQTDYLLLSNGQRMKALRALKDLE